ncbi:MAG: Trk family potassium uptake protein [Lachnospiraceae bacterium]|nr:Trk family potassium uptake protein [Lachnospiraceae bacterium]
MEQIRRNRHLSSAQIIAIGFFMVIMVGCMLLMLPVATSDGRGASFLDALFTATSSVCVTGLAVQNTATYWSFFGQLVILFLIQVGGMGVVTVAVCIAILSGKRIGLMQRTLMQESIAGPSMRGIVRLTSFILKITVATELLGAVFMAPVFCRQFGPAKGLWYAVFHSISAFCNAGFDLMGTKTPFCSLMGYMGQPVINIVIMVLIIWGGIGFLTWEDIFANTWNWKKYRMQSKVILIATALFIVLPAAYFFFIEFAREEWAGMPVGQRVLASFFQSVTTRTAGFNTVDFAEMTEGSQAIVIMLMLIGGSPGSTAGGMKTTSIVVLLASTLSVFQKNEDAHCFGRRIGIETVKYAAAVMVMYITLFSAGGIAISMIEELPVTDCLFETASAIGTVGLTLGLTPGLSAASRVILILLMYLGRVGGLTVVFAAMSNRKIPQSKYPQEKIAVG